MKDYVIEFGEVYTINIKPVSTKKGTEFYVTITDDKGNVISVRGYPTIGAPSGGYRCGKSEQIPGGNWTIDNISQQGSPLQADATRYPNLMELFCELTSDAVELGFTIENFIRTHFDLSRSSSSLSSSSSQHSFPVQQPPQPPQPSQPPQLRPLPNWLVGDRMNSSSESGSTMSTNDDESVDGSVAEESFAPSMPQKQLSFLFPGQIPTNDDGESVADIEESSTPSIPRSRLSLPRQQSFLFPGDTQPPQYSRRTTQSYYNPPRGSYFGKKSRKKSPKKLKKKAKKSLKKHTRRRGSKHL